ncbi:uncharacterized protein Tco025E_06542 [Trypanosoma conorhini]|uniref:Uncharacterized protein n=1 Tax=Trypanosoma conorhini TaxID=83891 RepID=A0A3R7P318_9TRYP|nr:uncharacterized protein Tco025E_06542 [Trypanosoma conorhini]RNF11972.1 hypothetical protein Tco025E_06542 [Trypanosoma conorhini]
MWTNQFTLQKPQSQQTPEEKHEQALVTANVFIENNRSLVRKAIDKYQSVAGSNYWTYGYMGGAMVTTMAACLSVGGRVPFFRNYASWISLAGGYFGGKAMLGVHNSYNLASVVRVINTSIDETRKMDEQYGFSISEYAREVDALQQMKYELMPYSTEAIEARKHDVKSMPLDERVDALVDAYEKRRHTAGQKK